jgi:hypothetical protein
MKKIIFIALVAIFSAVQGYAQGRGPQGHGGHHEGPRTEQRAPHHEPMHYHHPHPCYFDSWYWYTWGGYERRFICHSRYQRYFDSVLGYYLWGSMTAPTRIDLGKLSLTRYQNNLKVSIEGQTSYLNLYKNQTVKYQADNTLLDVTTGNGVAIIHFYDGSGNEATYKI